MTRFFNTAGDFVSDFFGGTSTAAKNKKKPNEGIAIDRKNDEKPKKKPEIVKKTAKNPAATKIKSEEPENEDSLLDNLESTLEELASDEKPSSADNKDDQSTTEETDDDDEDDDEDQYQPGRAG